MSEPASRHTADALARSSTAEAYQGGYDYGDHGKKRPHPYARISDFREDPFSAARE
jgi:hypothetical protein